MGALLEVEMKDKVDQASLAVVDKLEQVKVEGKLAWEEKMVFVDNLAALWMEQAPKNKSLNIQEVVKH